MTRHAVIVANAAECFPTPSGAELTNVHFRYAGRPSPHPNSPIVHFRYAGRPGPHPNSPIVHFRYAGRPGVGMPGALRGQSAAAAALAAAGRAVVMTSKASSSLRTRDEPGLEGTRRQVHTGVEHGVEEPAEGGGVLGASIVIGAHGVLAEEDREHRAGPLHRVRHTLGGEGGRGGIRDHGRRGLGRG